MISEILFHTFDSFSPFENFFLLVASNTGKKLGAKKSLQPKQSISNFDSENLDVTENANGQAQIKNLSHITIKSMSDVFDLIKEGVRR